MQQVPAFGILAVAGQFIEAWCAPDIGRDAPVLLQQNLGRLAFTQDGARAKQVDARLVLSGRFEQIQAFQDFGFGTGLQARHRIVLVQQGDVEINVFLVLHHALQAMLHDHRDFVGEGRVVGNAVRNRAGQDMAVAVLMLQAFAVQRRAPGGAAEQEAARLHVASRPGEVADALEAEHRVIDEERDHHPVVG